MRAVLAKRRRSPLDTGVGPEPDPAPDPRADELRAKLAESRTLVEERARFEEAETPVDEAEPVAPRAEVDERRRAVHEAGREAAAEMRETERPS